MAYPNRIPPKKNDPGIFSIPCSIGTMSFVDALCASGSSINLMPFSVYRHLGRPEPRPTSITLQMADRSTLKPKGIVEDFLIWVDHKDPCTKTFIFLADFVIIDIDEDAMPILIGRPCPQTTCALLIVEEDKLAICCFNEQLTFKVSYLMKRPKTLHSIFFIDFGEISTCEMADPVVPVLSIERRLT